MAYTFCNQPVEVTRIKNDINGNPRYVVHFLTVFNHPLAQAYKDYKNKDSRFYDVGYDIACTIAANAGFKRYHNKSYGGGLVFQSYNVQSDLDALDRAIDRHFELFFFIEITDTFGGECNYSWLRRYMVQAKNSCAAILKVAKYEGYAVKRDGMQFVGKNACIAIYDTDKTFWQAIDGDYLQDYVEL